MAWPQVDPNKEVYIGTHLRGLGVLLQALDRHNVGLEIAGHAHNPVERLSDAESVAER